MVEERAQVPDEGVVRLSRPPALLPRGRPVDAAARGGVNGGMRLILLGALTLLAACGPDVSVSKVAKDADNDG